MRNLLLRFVQQITLTRPWISWIILAILLGTSLFHARDFRLDASADSLLLQNDEDLFYFREIVKRYSADDFFIVTYTPDGDLFTRETLDRLKSLRDDLADLDQVKSVVSILDVPLIASPPVTLSDIQRETRTLLTPDMDLQMAKRELTTSPLYRNLLIDSEGSTTMLQVTLPRDDRYFELLYQRRDLEDKLRSEGLSESEQAELDRVSTAFTQRNSQLQAENQALIASVRNILKRHERHASLFLGGVPLIASDMIQYVQSDIRVFGIGIALFLVVLLTLTFRRPRWVLISAAICGLATAGMMGTLGLMNWPVTVVSSNFISLALIITLSLVIHLIVRYRELHAEQPDADQRTLLLETLRSKFVPSAFTALTTMVSFASLVVSDIKPVIDFGLMMVWGVGIAFLLTFLLFPAGLSTLTPGKPQPVKRDFTAGMTGALAAVVNRRTTAVMLGMLAVAIVMGLGISRLSVENRFIDYFKSSTEIYQGMYLIDNKLGGTTPLDVVLDADADFLEEMEEFPMEGVGLTGSSYWFNSFQLEEIERIHDYLDDLPETGKVLSLATTMDMLRQLNNNEPLDDFSLAVMMRQLPNSVKDSLFSPYMSQDGNQVRFSIRIIDSQENLNRGELIKKIHSDLLEKFDLAEEQVNITGMLVLYNNVLQSLFKSQMLTLVVVFVAIFLMLCLMFRSARLAFVGTLPTLFAASFILGLMGWLGIPLDIMTITIAAITIGIGVDDTIHYTHRFREEMERDHDYQAAMRRSHLSVGKAMYYTSVTITMGFSILALSNFIPSIYFGLLTGLAMVIALLANLTLLPALLIKTRGFG